MQRNLSFFIGLIFLSLCAISAFGQGYTVQYTQNRSDAFTLDVNLEEYDIRVVEKNDQSFSDIIFEGDINLTKAGWAELPFVNLPVQLSSDRNVDVEIVESSYVDIQLDEPLLPSRGAIYRNQDPAEIPYDIDPASLIDTWYPEQVIENGSPYILRKVRGQNIRFQIFQYNAVQQRLRIYTHIRISIIENTQEPINPLPEVHTRVNVEMAPIYQSLFLNYNQNLSRWADEIGEFGDILVIYTARDATAIQAWIEWKQQKGYHVDELQVTTGTNVGSDIQSAYNANNNLLYVLLVGDWADIKSDLGSDSAPTDPMLGCVAGADDYFDIIIGRFSAENTADVTAQVYKTIAYEKTPDSDGAWYQKALGIASDEGAGGGDDGESDIQQIENIHNGRLLPTTYTNAYEEFDPGASATNVQNYINGGLSVINYCGHGGSTSWVSSGYANSHVNSAVNGNKLPFIFSVACVNGAFHENSDCFAEAFLRSSNGGAIATWMSTINQPWTPPMRGQDYANDLLIQGYNYNTGFGSGTNTSYGRTTFGSITFNAATLMISESETISDRETYETWTIFGDPSVQLRTDQPKDIVLSNLIVSPGVYTTQVNVDGSGFEGAIVSLWQAGSSPASAMTDASGNVSIDHSFSGIVKLTVTGFNLDTYHADHSVGIPEIPICDFSANQTSIIEGESIQFTDNSVNYPSAWAWNFGDGGTSTEKDPEYIYLTAGTYTVSLTVTNAAGDDTKTEEAFITVDPNIYPPVSDFIADHTEVSIGASVNFTDLSENFPTSWEWTFEGGNIISSTEQNPSVIYDTPGTYNVTLTASNAFGEGTIETKADYITVSLPEYCDAGSNSSNFEYISNVALGSINNTSFASTYTDYSSISTDAYANDDLSLTVTASGTYSSDQLLVWADWNRDGDFEDAYEAIWTSATGIGPFTTTISVPNGIAPGPVRLRLRLEDTYYNPTNSACGFSSYGEVEDYTINVVSLEPAPIASFTVNPMMTCDGIVQFTDASTGASSWTWDFGDGNISNEQNPEHTYIADGVYTASLTISNPGGSDTHSEIINVEIPDATIESVGPFCVYDEAVSLSAATAGGTWSGTGVVGASFNPSVAGLGNHQISYEVTIATCTDIDEITVLVIDSFDATIVEVDPLCETDDAVTLNAATIGGEWSGTGVSGDQFDPSIAGAGSHEISYTIGSGNCVSSDMVLITVDAMPNPQITSPAAICLAEVSMELMADVVGGIWYGTGVSDAIFNAETAGIGTHNITYEVTVGACTDLDAIDILVGDAPTVTFNVTDASTSSSADGAVATDVSGGLAPYVYLWSNGDTSESIENLLAGEYALSVTDAAGCETIISDILVDFMNSISSTTSTYAVYPNPAQNEVYVQLENMNVHSIELVNVLGQPLLSLFVEEELTRIDLSGIVSGVYFIRMNANDKQIIEKLMVD